MRLGEAQMMGLAPELVSHLTAKDLCRRIRSAMASHGRHKSRLGAASQDSLDTRRGTAQRILRIPEFSRVLVRATQKSTTLQQTLSYSAVEHR